MRPEEMMPCEREALERLIEHAQGCPQDSDFRRFGERSECR
jgi:hypothetical protein